MILSLDYRGGQTLGVSPVGSIDQVQGVEWQPVVFIICFTL